MWDMYGLKRVKDSKYYGTNFNKYVGHVMYGPNAELGLLDTWWSQANKLNSKRLIGNSDIQNSIQISN